jgi:hypothetical protein
VFPRVVSSDLMGDRTVSGLGELNRCPFLEQGFNVAPSESPLSHLTLSVRQVVRAGDTKGGKTDHHYRCQHQQHASQEDKGYTAVGQPDWRCRGRLSHAGSRWA